HQHGKGSVSTASAVLKKAAFVFTPQAQQPAATNPPELIAAAHAGSFSIALANELDRKSTRLNSSHSQISYAVFCLKKKKNHPSNHSILSVPDSSNTIFNFQCFVCFCITFPQHLY